MGKNPTIYRMLKEQHEASERVRRALWLAAGSGDLQTLTTLYEQGADLNAVDENGRTPLHDAVGNSQFEASLFLLNHGANVNASFQRMSAPLSIAAKKGSLKLAQLLLERGANVDQRNADGKAALYFAVEARSLEVVQLLLEHGADMTLETKFGRTALDKAIAGGYDELVVAFTKAQEERETKRQARASQIGSTRLDRVAIAGADEKVAPEELIRLSQEFPFVEWSILYSGKEKPLERYPSLAWILELTRLARGTQTRLSLHLCSKAVKDLIRGRDGSLAALRDNLDVFARVQLNAIYEYEYGYLPILSNHIKKGLPHNPQIIIQLTGAGLNKQVGESLEHAGVNVAYLYDSSGGHGKVVRVYQAPQGEYCGYAGGLTPENLEEQFVEIASVVGEHRFYLDMESGVRDSADQFDLTRVRSVLEFAAKRISTV